MRAIKPDRHIFALTHEVVKNFARMSGSTPSKIRVAILSKIMVMVIKIYAL